MNGFRECSSCGALYTKSCACSKGGFIDKCFCDPNKTPDSSQRPPQDCPKCGNSVDGLYCRHCALLRKKLKDVWFIICDEHKSFQDFLNTSKSSNDDSNIVSMPQEPIIFNQDPGENSSQSPPQIDHHCCYGCGDSLEDIFCQRCTCKSCGNGAHHGYNCLSKVLIISNLEPCHDQNVEEFPQTLPSLHPTCYSGDESSFAYDSTPNLVKDSPNIFNPPSQPPTYSNEFCGYDVHYSYDCPPQVPFIYNPELCYNQNFNFPQNFQSFQQQYPCCESYGGLHNTFQCQQVIFYDPCYENYGGPHETFRCQTMNCYEPNPCYDSNYSSFDNFQPSQPVIDHLNLQQRINDSMIELRGTFQDWLQHRKDQVESSTPLRDIIISELPPYIAITSVLSTKDSLIIGDEHLDTIPKKELDKFIKSTVENLIPNPTDCDLEEEIRLIEILLYNNSSLCPSEEINCENFDAAIESFSSSPILVEDSDCLMEDIDLSLTLDDSMPSAIKDDDYESKGDILILEELPSNDSLSLPENKSFHFDIPSSLRPPAKPPDDAEIKPNL
uniref:Pre-mRNA splicing Prp18-interacting factor n=1 Tax=Tanacetum cinerariifolium TaxID=118510 RepID=A0A699GWC7_TANCI|nr:hypothetical protein [Tanacetum cinerariifolium]